MCVELLFFAAIQELLGTGRGELRLERAEISVAELPELLTVLYPALAGRLASVRFAVNESFAVPTDRVQDGDVVALIPPVSGG